MKRSVSILLLLALVLSLGMMTPVLAKEPVTLVFAERYGNPTRTPALRKLLDEFEAANPDIKIELISPPLESSQQKIQQMLMAQNELDLMEVTAWDRAQFVENGWIADLSEYYKTYDEAKTYRAGVGPTLLVNGKYYTVPIGGYDRMIYYRTDWMEELGLKFPEPGPEWTFDALYDIAKQMTDPEKGRYGWALRGAGNAYQQFPMQVMYAAGNADMISIEEPYFTASGASLWGTDAGRKGLEFQLKFYKDCSPQDSISWQFSDQVNAFSSGICGLLMQDSDCLGIFKSNMEEGTWDTYPMPVDADTKKAAVGRGADGWGMTSYSKHPDEAWRVLAFLGSAEINARFCKEYGVLPAHTNAAEYDPEFETGYYAPYTYMYNEPDTYIPVGGVDLPYTVFINGFGKSADVDLQNLLMGNTTVEEIQAKWDKEWTEAREEFGGYQP